MTRSRSGAIPSNDRSRLIIVMPSSSSSSPIRFARPAARHGGFPSPARCSSKAMRFGLAYEHSEHFRSSVMYSWGVRMLPQPRRARPPPSILAGTRTDMARLANGRSTHRLRRVRRHKRYFALKMFAVSRRCRQRNISPGAVAEVVGMWGGVVSGVRNPVDSGVGAPEWRPRHDERYHDAWSW